MASDSAKCNQNLYCEYHQEPDHTTDDCRNLKNHLDRLVREGKLRHLLQHPVGRQEQTSVEARQSTLRPSIGTINVILAAPRRTGSHPFRVMSVARLPGEADDREFKRAKGMASPILGFSDEDKVGTIQPHDDALVVTLRIEGYHVRRLLIDQGSAVEVMYPDLYKGLKLRSEDLTAYDSFLVSFEGKTVTLKGQIRLPIQIGSDIVEVDFIVVDAYSPLHRHYSQTVASCLRSCIINLTPKGEVLVRGSGQRSDRGPSHGPVMHGVRHLVTTEY